ncbi:unnamed protein product [Ixodes pacificus]
MQLSWQRFTRARNPASQVRASAVRDRKDSRSSRASLASHTSDESWHSDWDRHRGRRDWAKRSLVCVRAGLAPTAHLRRCSTAPASDRWPSRVSDRADPRDESVWAPLRISASSVLFKVIGHLAGRDCPPELGSTSSCSQ